MAGEWKWPSLMLLCINVGCEKCFFATSQEVFVEDSLQMSSLLHLETAAFTANQSHARGLRARGIGEDAKVAQQSSTLHSARLRRPGASFIWVTAVSAMAVIERENEGFGPAHPQVQTHESRIAVDNLGTFRDWRSALKDTLLVRFTCLGAIPQLSV